MIYVELVLEAGASIIQDLSESFNGFIYVFEGNGYFWEEETRGKLDKPLKIIKLENLDPKIK